MPRIPTTPHRPSTDAFWIREFVDDWNAEHSHRKLFDQATVQTSSDRSPAKKVVPKKAGKFSFEKIKHEMASNFLQELDDTVTGAKLGELAASTGGIKIAWTNKLNTTA